MPGANRHRPPSNNQLFERIYRKQIASDLAIRELTAEVARLTASSAIRATVLEHCRRLIAEKQTLLQVVEANQFMSAALPRRTA